MVMESKRVSSLKYLMDEDNNSKPSQMVVALTGTTTRMKSLPYAAVSSPQNFGQEPQEYATVDRTHQQTLITDDAKRESESLVRKCVYTYEDKYAFTRIIANDSLVFDSHFESANLHSAFRVMTQIEAQSGNPFFRKHQYELYIHNDLYTNGNTQWYYFRVGNTRAGQEVTFHIKNFQKADSLYNEGMRPLFLSLSSNRGWDRCGTNIRYFPSSSPCSISQPTNGNSKLPLSYTLAFTVTFASTNDTCYFAYSYPYTYSDLCRYLNSLHAKLRPPSILRRSQLCRTIAGNKCELLTITATADSPEVINSRAVIFITSRVHPGETNSSWIMQGIIEFLVSDTREARELRNLYVFKLIPMLNPDGVINGNYRCSLAGCDLNRKWSNPDPKRHPTIFQTKVLMKTYMNNRKIGYVLDLHGHSRKKGIFVYGCIPDKRLLQTQLNGISDNKTVQRKVAFSGGYKYSSSSSSLNHKKSLSTENRLADATCFKLQNVFLSWVGQISSSLLQLANSCGFSSAQSWEVLEPNPFPSPRELLSWRVNFLPRIFNCVIPTFATRNCSFTMHKSKAGTMRIVAFAEIGIDCVYTVEASLAGADMRHYLIDDYIQHGKSICIGLLLSFPSTVESFINHDNIDGNICTGIMKESSCWKKYVIPIGSSIGISLMTEGLRNEMINGTGEQFTDDSDNDTVALERAMLKAKSATDRSEKRKPDTSKGTEKMLDMPKVTPVSIENAKQVRHDRQSKRQSAKSKQHEHLGLKDKMISKLQAQGSNRTRRQDKASKRVMALSVVGCKVDEKIVSSDIGESCAIQEGISTGVESASNWKSARKLSTSASLVGETDNRNNASWFPERDRPVSRNRSCSEKSLLAVDDESVSPFTQLHASKILDASAADVDDARVWSTVVGSYLTNLSSSPTKASIHSAPRLWARDDMGIETLDRSVDSPGDYDQPPIFQEISHRKARSRPRSHSATLRLRNPLNNSSVPLTTLDFHQSESNSWVLGPKSGSVVFSGGSPSCLADGINDT